MNAGAKLDFGKAEVYWPQDDAASSQYQELLGLDAKPSAQDQSLVQPMFDAKVTINAQIDVLVTPEVSSQTIDAFAPLDYDDSWAQTLSVAMHTLTYVLTGQHGTQNWRHNNWGLSSS